MQHLEISANTINAFNKIDEDWLYCMMFDNTCDRYEGIWDSCYLFNYLGCNHEFVVNEQGASSKFDLIVLDLTDDISVDENNTFMSKIFYDMLRPNGLIVGYGGADLTKFMSESPIPLFDIEDFHVFKEYFPSWDDYGVFMELENATFRNLC